VTVVRWTDQAVEDLRSIRLFIERDSPRYGRLVAERLYDATSQIELFPYSGRMVPELNREDMRELIVGDYHIEPVPVSWTSRRPNQAAMRVSS
jgi:plasmid stabilization system protein ParE